MGILGHLIMIFFLLLVLNRGLLFLYCQIKEKPLIKSYKDLTYLERKNNQEKGNATLMGIFSLQCFLVLGCPLLLVLEKNEQILMKEFESYSCLQSLFVNNELLNFSEGQEKEKEKENKGSSCHFHYRSMRNSKWIEITLNNSKDLILYRDKNNSLLKIKGKGFWKDWCGSSLI